tara:strand:+ start:3531 stop:4616 length:1086 start_codon:yes stop_codon:yes gene_type:complete
MSAIYPSFARGLSTVHGRNEHLRHHCKLKVQLIEVDNKLVVSMPGNTMRAWLALGSKVIDPLEVDESLDYDEDTWLDARVVTVLGEAFNVFQRIDTTLRVTAFGNESGSMRGTFTAGLQTYFRDVHYINVVYALLGRITMTIRSLRDVLPCGLVLAVRSGFAYGLFGEDGGEAKHHVEHILTRQRTPGGRGHADRRERNYACLEYITLIEKIKEDMLNDVLHETLVRHLGVMQQLAEKGFGPLARFPSWRHPDINSLAIFGELPRALADAVSERPSKRPKAAAAEAFEAEARKEPSMPSSPGGASFMSCISSIASAKTGGGSPSSHAPSEGAGGGESQPAGGEVQDGDIERDDGSGTLWVL